MREREREIKSERTNEGTNVGEKKRKRSGGQIRWSGYRGLGGGGGGGGEGKEKKKKAGEKEGRDK